MVKFWKKNVKILGKCSKFWKNWLKFWKNGFSNLPIFFRRGNLPINLPRTTLVMRTLPYLLSTAYLNDAPIRAQICGVQFKSARHFSSVCSYYSSQNKFFRKERAKSQLLLNSSVVERLSEIGGLNRRLRIAYYIYVV